MATILIVDSDLAYRKALADLVRDMDLDVVAVGTLQDALTQLHASNFDIVMTDMWLPDGNVISSLPRFMEHAGEPKVIVYSNLGDPKEAKLALNFGAWDYLDKGADKEAFRLTLKRALQYRREQARERAEPQEDTTWAPAMGILGQSKALKQCLTLADKAAKTEVVACITGETGTGKGLVARAIHERSSRSPKPFVVVDCASLPKNLVESELFGFVKGAFTGASMSKTGLVALADGGTLFLDEVGELPMGVQGAFLRVLQERRFRPVGSEQEKVVDFRLIVATNRDLDRMVKENTFRQDLLYRINTWRIELPPLRDRGNDVVLLSRRFIDSFCQKSHLPTKTISPEFLNVIKGYDWPGNIRELVNTLESVITLAGDAPMLYRKHLPKDLVARYIQSQTQEMEHAAMEEDDFTPPSWKKFREDALQRAEQEYFKSLLAFVNYQSCKAIQISGLSKSQFYKLLKKIEKHQ